MKSAKSPIESLSTRASRAWGAFGRTRDPEILTEVTEAGLNCLGGLGDLGDLGGKGADTSVGGLERRADNLVTEVEWDRPVGDRGP